MARLTLYLDESGAGLARRGGRPGDETGSFAEMQPNQNSGMDQFMSADATTPPVECAGGSLVPQTGIYILEHSCSRTAQKVVAVRGQRFLTCPECVDGGRYVLERAVTLVTEDPDLTSEASASKVQR